MSEFDSGNEQESIVVPDRCRACPPLQCIFHDLGYMAVTKALTTQAGYEAMMGMPTGMRASFADHFNREHGDELARQGITAEQVITGFETSVRQNIGETLEDLDGHTAIARTVAAAMISSCDGSLTMRASRGGVEYLTTICTSPVPNPYSDRATIKHNRQ